MRLHAPGQSPEGLPQAPLRSIPEHRSPEPPPRSDPDPPAVPRRPNVKHKISAEKPTTLPVDPAELDGAGRARLGGRSHPPVAVLLGRGQAVPAPSPPPAEHVAPPRSANPSAKPMGPAPTPSVWLKSALHKGCPPGSAAEQLQKRRGQGGASTHYNIGRSGHSTRHAEAGPMPGIGPFWFDLWTTL